MSMSSDHCTFWSLNTELSDKGQFLKHTMTHWDLHTQTLGYTSGGVGQAPSARDKINIP